MQTNYALAFTNQPPASAIVGQALSPAPEVELTESLVAATAATSPIVMSGSPSFLGGATVENLACGSATFSDLLVRQISGDELLTATLSLNASRPLKLNAQASTGVATIPISIALTASGSTLAGPVETFTWTAVPGAITHDLCLGTTGAGSNNLWGSGSTTATSVTFNGLPTNGGKIYARLFTYFSGGSGYADYIFTAATPAELTSPPLNTPFTGASETFEWTTVSSATHYSIWVGSTGPGSNDLGYTQGGTTSTSFTLNSLPTNGETIYVRLWTNYPSGGPAYIDYTFTAF